MRDRPTARPRASTALLAVLTGVLVVLLSALLATAPASAAKKAGGKPRPAPSPTGSPTPTESPAPTPTVSPSPGPTTSPARLRFGVSTPGGPTAAGELDHVAHLVGEQPSVVLSYVDFGRDLPVAELDAVRARGAEAILTWEPWRAGAGVDQPAFALDRISAGDHDAYLTRWGRDLAAWGHPVTLRFAHEMNGDWYPWAQAVNGGGAGDYVAAWRHVHDVVEATGADVTWVWSPNVPYPGATPMAQLYPGDDYVDVVALDGYNWGTSQTWSSWQGPAELFGPGLGELRAVAPAKPVVIAETSSAEAGGDKAAWARDLVTFLATQPDVTTFVWFHHDKETDWRIDSSPAVATALAAALADR